MSFGPDVRGKRRVIVTPETGEPKNYDIPKGKHIAVHEGDFVRAGEALMGGSSNPHDILKIKGEKELAKYLLDEVQEVYRLQGVSINDKHIEVIVRQMLRWVRITEVGDTDFLIGEQVEKHVFDDGEPGDGGRGQEAGARPRPMLLGITKASLSTESFISAASFQETTKVLTEASISGKTDRLLRSEGERDHGPADPGGYGHARATATWGSGSRARKRSPRKSARSASPAAVALGRRRPKRASMARGAGSRAKAVSSSENRGDSPSRSFAAVSRRVRG